jgi:hypothetical protein
VKAADFQAAAARFVRVVFPFVSPARNVMTALTLDLFAAATDPEAARYRILAGLQEARRSFARSRVYPSLAELIRLRRGLTAFLDGVEDFRDARPGRVSGVDWETGELRYERDADEPPLLAEDLAHWALPLVTELAEEGRALFEFVDEHAALEAVGLVPSYQAEGYLLVPDPESGLVALRYTVSALAGEDGRYRSLRTAPVPIRLAPMAPPHTWKSALISAFPDLPTPATFRLDSALAFPVEATMLPIAKRKLLRLVTDHGVA